jgi:hypothetical protein
LEFHEFQAFMNAVCRSKRLEEKFPRRHLAQWVRLADLDTGARQRIVSWPAAGEIDSWTDAYTGFTGIWEAIEISLPVAGPR